MRISIVAVVCFLAACGDGCGPSSVDGGASLDASGEGEGEGEGEGDDDGGAPLDSGRDAGVVDAGALVDGGGLDAGALVDGGAVDDGGGFIDGGALVDGGAADPDGGLVDGGVLVDAGAGVDAGARVDGGSADAGADDAGPGCVVLPQGVVGAPCAVDVECDSAPSAGDGVCFDEDDGWPAQGACTTGVGSCTADAGCAAGDVCSSIGGFPACLVPCGSCPCGFVCAHRLESAIVDPPACVPGDDAATDGDACASFGDCTPGSVCLDDPYEAPGGACSVLDCTLGDDATCAGGRCVPRAEGDTACFAACDDGCREAEGYACVDVAGDAGAVCRHPQIGDACAIDEDCGPADAWDCRTGTGFSGGACTLAGPCNAVDGSGCTDSSACYDPAGVDAAYCVDRCTGSGQGTCRVGYSCVTVGTTTGCVGN